MIKWKEYKFIQGIMNKLSFKKLYLPQVVLLGRSNVGKSSLINKLLNNRNVAKISNKPGKTQEINLFTVDKKIHLLDFPGYGYAVTSKEKQYIWQDLFDHYLQEDYGFKLFCILIDSKVGKKKTDHQMLSLLNYFKVNYIEVYTKADKIKKMDDDKLYVSTKFNINNLKSFINTNIFEV